VFRERHERLIVPQKKGHLKGDVNKKGIVASQGFVRDANFKKLFLEKYNSPPPKEGNGTRNTGPKICGADPIPTPTLMRPKFRPNLPLKRRKRN